MWIGVTDDAVDEAESADVEEQETPGDEARARVVARATESALCMAPQGTSRRTAQS